MVVAHPVKPSLQHALKVEASQVTVDPVDGASWDGGASAIDSLNSSEESGFGLTSSMTGSGKREAKRLGGGKYPAGTFESNASSDPCCGWASGVAIVGEMSQKSMK